MRYHTPKAASALVGVSVSSLRNYCATYKDFLSPEASPPAGAERKLSDRDIAVLQRVVDLRGQGMDTNGIVATLQTEDTSALQPYIDATTTPPSTTEALQPATTPTQHTELLAALQTLADDRYSALRQRIEAMEARQGDRLQWFVFGIVAGVLLVGVVAAIVLAGAMLR